MVSRSIWVDDTDSRIQYTGSGWFQDHGSLDNLGDAGPPYRSTLHGIKEDGFLSFNFTGTSVSVIGSKDVRNNSGGPFSECFIDNISLGLMQQTQGPADNNIPLCLQYGLVDGPHILTLNVTVFKGQAFWFDRIEYAPSASVALNNESIFIFGTDPALEYGTGWELDKESLANFTQTSKSTFAFSFIGVSFSWYAVIPFQFPEADALGNYTVDGQDPVQFAIKAVPRNSTTWLVNRKFFETSQYPQGPHDVVVTYLGNSSTAPLSLDYLIVQNGSFTPINTPTPMTSSPTSGVVKNPPSHPSNSGTIAGGGVAGLALILLVAYAIIYFRRWKGKQLAKSMYNHREDDSDSIVQPFHLAASHSSVPLNHSDYTPLAKRAGNAAQNGPMSSQTRTKPNSAIPPRSALGQNHPSTGGIHPFIPAPEDTFRATASNTSNQQQGMSETLRSLPTNILQQPMFRQETSTPLQGANPGSSRMVVHEDSGLRLPDLMDGDAGLNIVEMPPVYTAS